MSNFKIDDWVYASDWCYGQIMDIDEEAGEALVSYETERGGGSFYFDISELTAAEPPEEYTGIKRLCNWSMGGNHITGEFSLTLFNLDENGDEVDTVYIDMTKKERDNLYNALKRFIELEEEAK